MYKSKNLTFISISQTYLHIVQVQSQGLGQTRITGCYAKEISGVKDEDISRVLLQEIKVQKINVKQVIAVLERKNVFLKQMTLPSSVSEELKKMAELQILQYMPNAEDVSWDYSVLNKEPDGGSRILCMAAYNESINRYLHIFTLAKIHPAKVTISSFGILELFFLKGRALNAAEPSVLIYLTAGTMEIIFVENHKLYFSRYIPFGSDHLKEEKKAILDQINLTFSSFRKERLGDQCKQIILISSETESEVLKTLLEDTYALPVQAFSPVDLLPRIEKQGNISSPESSSFAILGLSLSDPRHLPNLLPGHLKNKKKMDYNKWVLLQTVLLGVLTFTLGITALAVQGYKKALVLDRTEKKLMQMKLQVKDAEEKSRRLNILKQNLDRRTLAVDIIKELYAFTPPEIAYDVVELARDGRIILEGQTQSASSINRLQTNLLSSSVFSDVSLEYSARRESPQGDKTFFRITCQKAKK